MNAGFWEGLGIGALVGGVVLVFGNAVYQHFFGEPHARRVALFDLKAEEVRRAFDFAQSVARIQNEYLRLQSQYPQVHTHNQQVYAKRISDIQSKLCSSVREADLRFLTLSEDAARNYNDLYDEAESYIAYLDGVLNHYVRGVTYLPNAPTSMTIQSRLLSDAMTKEIKQYLKGKGFPKVEYEWWWKKAPLWWTKLAQWWKKTG